MKNFLSFLFLFLCVQMHAEDLHLNFYFSSDMVLQAGKPIPVKGYAKPGKTVTVRFRGTTVKTKAGTDGQFRALLPAMDYQNEGAELTVRQGNELVTLSNVTVGDVWLCSGQSNMEMMVGEVRNNYPNEVKHDAGVRILSLKPSRKVYHVPYSAGMRDSVASFRYWADTKWGGATDDKVINPSSAVAYFFAQRLREDVHHNIGLVQTPVGGTPLEAFVDSATLQRVVPEYLQNDYMHNDLVQDWVRHRAIKNCESASDKQSHPHPFKPGYQYCVGVRPLCDFPIKGIIWYQGESNANQIAVYELLFPALVDSWRKAWNDDTLPFYTVQISSIERELWPDFRNTQRILSYTIPHSGLAVSSDCGHRSDVHPKQKKPVGERLARLALHRTYGFDIEDQGPTFVRFEPSSSLINEQQRKALGANTIFEAQRAVHPDLTAVAIFSHAKGLTTSDGEAPSTFEVAGADGIYHPARAIIASLPTATATYSSSVEAGVVLLFCPEVQHPLHVRYGWKSFSEGNLINGEGLPCSTFQY
ncbi:MAG: hypothetical protein KBT12_05790 [Bacteroidales bacterium]|nr:hypothetical protein [Candidatus Physcousia equi]